MDHTTSTGPGSDARVLAGVCSADEVLRILSEAQDLAETVDLDWIGATECARLVAGLATIGNRVAALQTRAARVVSGSSLVHDSGATSAGDLFGKAVGGDPSEGQAIARRASRIVPASLVETSYAAGALTGRQVDIITTALHRLPDELPAVDRERCEQILVEAAQKYSLRDLRRQADRITEIYLPPVQADAAEADLVHAREQAAWRECRATLTDLHDGTHRLTATLPTLPAQMLKAALDACTTPRRTHPGHGASRADEVADALADADHLTSLEDAGNADEAERVRRTIRHERITVAAERERWADPAHRLGLALAEILTHLPTDHLPTGAGTGAQLIITMTEDTLTGRLEQAGLTELGATISPAALRQTACGAGIIPMILNSRSEPLDVGRSQRLHTRTQRLALAARDGGCTFPGCDRSPSWTEAHHLTTWHHGGPTSVADGALLCPHHHRHIHQQNWQSQINPDTGHVQWRPHPWRPWQTNTRYQPTRIPPGQHRPDHDLAA